MNSRSRVSTSSWLVVVVLVLLTGAASAGRKRVVVLDFDGDKAEKFHADLVKILKKSHTVVSVDKWNGAAEEMSATTIDKANIKKVAKKLKIDGVISGSVEKRREQYILRLKLRAGTSGDIIGGQVNIQAEGPRLDGNAARDIKDELVEAIGGLESNRGGAASEEEEEAAPPPPKKGKAAEPVEEEEEAVAPPRASKFGGKKMEEEKGGEKVGKKGKKEEPVAEEPVAKADKGKKGKKAEEELAAKEEENPLPKKAEKKAPPPKEEEPVEDTKPPKKVAVKEDPEGDGEGVEASSGAAMDEARMYSPGERALVAVAGLSFTGRRMAFSYTGTKPPGYKQLLPLPGFMLDATLYPLAMSHKSKGLGKNFGATVLFDRVLYINTKGLTGMKLASTEQRYAFGVAFRYPFNDSATSPVVGGTLRYGQKTFQIAGDAGVPSVAYTIIDPTAFFEYPLNDKLILGVKVGFMAVTGTGAIQTQAQYGPATVTGFETELSGDYLLKGPQIFIRAGAKLETFGYAFKGTGDKSNMGAVAGARDTYFGGFATAGYLF